MLNQEKPSKRKPSKRKLMLMSLALALVIFAAGCKKKAPAPPPPPPPPPPTVTAPPTPAAPRITQFTADPTSIQRGQSSTLRWEVSGDTNSISIDQGIGAVQATGNRRVFPTDSTTYTLTASGPGGSVSARATINVSAPPPPPPPPTAVTKPPFPEALSGQVQDAYFDYDKSDIRSDARDALTKDASALKSILADYPNARVVVEGHCDERGSAEYNLGLGDRRATSAKEFLVQLGVPSDRLTTISYGKERPVCTEHDETCWQKNRRAHFAPGQ
jgi:peptidoglycan-associated lipoprotein